MRYNNINKLVKCGKDLFYTLNLIGLDRISPIFRYFEIHCGKTVIVSRQVVSYQAQKEMTPTNEIRLLFPDAICQRYWGENQFIDPGDVKEEHNRWIVYDDIATYCSTIHNFQEKGMELGVNVYRINEKECPIYIQELYRVIKKFYKNSVLIITDHLPWSLVVQIILYYGWGQRESLLSTLADFLGLNERMKTNNDLKKRYEELYSNKKISLKEALNEIIHFYVKHPKTNFSYCLCCGDEIDATKKFCDATGKSGKQHRLNKDNCRNKFRYWLKARLKIKGNLILEKQEQLYSELQKLIKGNPLSAYEILKRKHPKLYTKQYKERWERERKQKL